MNDDNPKLHVIYDPSGRLEPHLPAPCKTAMLCVAEDLESVDIYRLAQKLAELLLEQLR